MNAMNSGLCRRGLLAKGCSTVCRRSYAIISIIRDVSGLLTAMTHDAEGGQKAMTGHAISHVGEDGCQAARNACP